MTAITRWRLILLASLAALFFITLAVLSRNFTVQGDGVGYVQAMRVLSGTPAPAGFVPNRILTTFLALESILALSHVLGGILPAWYLINAACFFGVGFLSFELFRRISESAMAGCFAALITIANYDMLVFGLTYLMDIGSWTCYLGSLFFLWRYVEKSERRDLSLAALIAGVGGLWKEYAFVALVPIACLLLWENRASFDALVRRSWLPALIAITPALLVHSSIFFIYHYTYLEWYGTNNSEYGFSSQIPEIIKDYGVVLSVAGFSTIAGLYFFAKELRARAIERRDIFLLSLLVPPLLICAWPGLTERVVFLAVPTAAAFSALFFKQLKRWWIVPPAVIVYAIISLTTDSYILAHVTLPF